MRVARSSSVGCDAPPTDGRLHALITLAVIAAIIVLGVPLAFTTGPAHAVSFTVNSQLDEVDADLDDEVCETASGVCTLRAAVQQANALEGPDTINLPAGTYQLTIPGANEAPRPPVISTSPKRSRSSARTRPPPSSTAAVWTASLSRADSMSPRSTSPRSRCATDRSMAAEVPCMSGATAPWCR